MECHHLVLENTSRLVLLLAFCAVVVLLERTEMEVTDSSDACYVCKASTSVLVGFCIERWRVAEAICFNDARDAFPAS